MGIPTAIEDPMLPTPNARFHGRSQGPSGRATAIAEALISIYPEVSTQRAERHDGISVGRYCIWIDGSKYIYTMAEYSPVTRAGPAGG